MNNAKQRHLSLNVAAVMDFLPAVTQCVETASLFFGLGKNESLKLQLASEEIFSYLCERVCRGNPVEILCRGGLFYARVEFHFTVPTLDMGALNMTTAISLDGDDDLTQMGLVIASRTVDRLFITTGMNNSVMLAMEQDKAYPPSAEVSEKAVDARGALSVAVPDAEALKRFALQMGPGVPDALLPAFFKYPGKVADMVAAGYCQALVAQDETGAIAGGLLSRPLTEKIVEVFSPCIFDPAREEEMTTLLMETCIAKTARTKAVGLVNLTGLPASLRPQFETLGEMTYAQEGGAPLIGQAFCRLLHEDPGCQVWTDAVLKDYLEKEYARLFLARDIRDVRNLGESASTGASIFACDIRRVRSEAHLRPLWPGQDLAENLSRHVALCQNEALKNIFFTLDLGISWHAHLAPVLMSQSFKPCVILPFAGQADLVIFQYDESES